MVQVVQQLHRINIRFREEKLLELEIADQPWYARGTSFKKETHIQIRLGIPIDESQFGGQVRLVEI